MEDRPRTRREFIKDASAAALAGTLYMNTPLRVFGKSSSTSRVVLVRHKEVIDNYNKPNEMVVQQMACPACQTQIPAGSKFCPKCGANLEGSSCKKCNAKLAPGAKFCPECGEKQE